MANIGPHTKRNKLGQVMKKYKTPQKMYEAIVKYFQWCEDNPITHVSKGIEFTKPRPITLLNMYAHMGISKQALSKNYLREDGKFAKKQSDGWTYADVHEWAKAKVEADYEYRMTIGEGSTAGLIFTLKNNFQGWSDRREYDHSGSVAIGPVTSEAEAIKSQVKDALGGEYQVEDDDAENEG